jgi:hypothetical protein
MNERIKQLAVEADIKFLDFHGREYCEAWVEQQEKFAKLIVRECRDIIGKTRDQAIEDDWNIDEAMSTAMYNIEERFGVEL